MEYQLFILYCTGVSYSILYYSTLQYLNQFEANFCIE